VNLSSGRHAARGRPGAGGGVVELAAGLEREARLVDAAPATRTLPVGRRVAVCPWRANAMLPVVDQVPVAGSYSSALAWEVKPSKPPATSTRPSDSSVAVWTKRAVLIESVSDQVPAASTWPTSAKPRRRITGRNALNTLLVLFMTLPFRPLWAMADDSFISEPEFGNPFPQA